MRADSDSAFKARNALICPTIESGQSLDRCTGCSVNNDIYIYTARSRFPSTKINQHNIHPSAGARGLLPVRPRHPPLHLTGDGMCNCPPPLACALNGAGLSTTARSRARQDEPLPRVWLCLSPVIELPDHAQEAASPSHSSKILARL